MAVAPALDAHAKPPTRLREVYKRFQKISADALRTANDIVTTQWNSNGPNMSPAGRSSFPQLPDDIESVLGIFTGMASSPTQHSAVCAVDDIPGMCQVRC